MTTMEDIYRLQRERRKATRATFRGELTDYQKMDNVLSWMIVGGFFVGGLALVAMAVMA